jgi:threonine synthase
LNTDHLEQFNTNTMSDNTTTVDLAGAPKNSAPVQPEDPKSTTHTPSQTYLSTRGGSYGV